MVKNASTGSITSNIATSAPASASPSANAKPHPRAPPVTRAVRPLRENYQAKLATVYFWLLGQILALVNEEDILVSCLGYLFKVTMANLGNQEIC